MPEVLADTEQMQANGKMQDGMRCGKYETGETAKEKQRDREEKAESCDCAEKGTAEWMQERQHRKDR